jgi:hypothetical protein
MARSRSQSRFDPYAILRALERQTVAYILVGAFARVIVGAEELTHGLDLTPSTREENLRRLDLALAEINARRPDGGEPAVQTADYEREPVVELETDHGEVKIVPYPAGTRGQGLRPSVASTRDLARMLSGLGREEDIPKLVMMRRLVELEHELHRGLSIEF